MNKKYVLAGFLFWASVSGYMGIRILDSYTEDAVTAALTCIPATAREVKFSFFSKNLVLEGLQYEIPDDKVQRKGTIDHIEINGFNRKILFVLPKMPEYDPAHLPAVAESIVATGITESRHENYARTEISLGSLELSGWRQRLGILLDRYARGGTDGRFFEELYRCGIDRVQASRLRVRQEDSRNKDAFQVMVDRVVLPSGITPPQNGENVRPLDVLLESPSCEGAGWHFSAGRLDLLGFTPPAPSSLGQMHGFDLEKLLAACAAQAGEQPLARPAATTLRLDTCRLLAKDSGHAATLAGFSMKVGPAEAGTGIDLALKELHIPTEALPQYAGSVERHAAGGIKCDLRFTGAFTGSGCVTSLEALLHGLGKLDLSASFSGDMHVLFSSALSQDRQQVFFKRLAEMRMERAKMTFEDSGLCALALEIAARKAGMEPLAFLEALDPRTGELEEGAEPDAMRDASRILQEQLHFPGTVTAELAQGRRPKLAQLALTALMQPAKLPIMLSSSPGKKPMRSFFQQ
jgi:hypothetical protein